MIKLADIIEKPLSGEWGEEDSNIEGTPVLRTTNFRNDGKIDYSDVVTRIIPKNKLDSKFLEVGDIIIEKSGGGPKQPVGRVVYFDATEKRYMYNNFTARLRMNSNNYYAKYIFYCLYYNHRIGTTHCYQNKTTGILNLQLDRYLSNISVKQITVQMQIDITDALDKVSHVIDMRKKQLEELDKLIMALFYDMFGHPVINEKEWHIQNLDNICEKITDGEHNNPIFVTEGVCMVMANNVQEKINFDNCRFVSADDFARFSRKCNPEKDDILLVSRGATIGRTCIVNTSTPFCLMGSVILLKANKTVINPHYFNAVFKDKLFHDKIIASSSASAQQAIYIKDLRKQTMPLPPLPLQNQFATIVEKIEEQKALVQKALDESQYLFDSLMDRYFGE